MPRVEVERVVTWQGVVHSVHFAPDAGTPMASPPAIQAIAGSGIQGDRYLKGTGHFSDKVGPRRQVTLFEAEVLEALQRDHGIDLLPDECRMNIVTIGVPVSHLVGRVIEAGGATIRGLQLNEPCRRLQDVVGKKILKALVHRCGIHAEVLSSGTIAVGDVVRAIDGRCTPATAGSQ